MALLEKFEQQGNWLFKYRSVIPLTILIIGTILYVRTEIYPDTFFLEGTRYEMYYELICLLISLIGFGIRIYTVGYSPKNTSGRNTTEGQVAEVLNTTGIYSIVRHPLYLGNFFMWLGPAMLTGHVWFMVVFLLFYWLYYERIMFAEEQFLRKKFGKHYIDWAEKVPAFIPNFKLFVKTNQGFSWKKVLEKEKNGLLALFLIFFVFDFSGELIENKTDFNYFLIIGVVASIIFYLTIKYLRRHTNIFKEE